MNIKKEEVGEPKGELSLKDQVENLRSRIEDQSDIIRKLTRRGEDVEVRLQFDIKTLGKEGMDKLFKVEQLLGDIGIGFDTGAGSSERDWELDWSLSGPIRVHFIRFTKDDAKNRYVRGNEKTRTANKQAKGIEKKLIENTFLKETC